MRTQRSAQVRIQVEEETLVWGAEVEQQVQPRIWDVNAPGNCQYRISPCVSGCLLPSGNLIWDPVVRIENVGRLYLGSFLLDSRFVEMVALALSLILHVLE